MITRISAVALVIGVLTLMTACGEGGVTPIDPGGPGATETPGTLTVQLETPNSGLDGAAVLILSGPTAPSSVAAGSGLELWGGPVETADATVALTGVLNAGTILTLQVDAVERVGEYTATLREVAMEDDSVALREDLSEYVLTVVR